MTGLGASELGFCSLAAWLGAYDRLTLPVCSRTAAGGGQVLLAVLLARESAAGG